MAKGRADGYNNHNMVDGYLESLLGRSKTPSIDPKLRRQLGEDGQHPKAIVFCCSDSRVVPELIFSCPIGELFVIRTAGNTLGDNEIASIDYAYHHLGVTRLIVLGHTHCGAIASALECEHSDNPLLSSIQSHIHGEKDPCKASALNAKEVAKEIQQRFDGLSVYALLYDIVNGEISTL